MVSPSPDGVAALVVEAAVLEARRVGIDSGLVSSIVADRGAGPAADRTGDSTLTPGEWQRAFVPATARPRLPTGDASRKAPVGWAIGVAHQAAETRETRRSRGAYYTPVALARGLVALVVEGTEPDVGPLRVCDPTCGAGGFLLCAAERLLDSGVPINEIGPSLVGYDIDPVAILAARLSLGLWLAAHGGEPASPLLRVHDALHGAEPPFVGDGFDVVVGNPPFLGQLRRRSARTGAQRSSLSSARGYADGAFVALERSLDWIVEGGRIALIQPQSVLAARDAKAVRSRIDTEAQLLALWVGDETIFDASVQVCAPIVEKGPRPPGSGVTHEALATYAGVDVAMSGRVGFNSWPELLADIQGVPELSGPGEARLRVAPGSGHGGAPGDAEALSTLAVATADFRDWFYWIAARVREAGAGRVHDVAVAGAPEPVGAVPVFTSGLIDPLTPLWGVRSARIGGERWEAPCIPADVVRTESDATSCLVPKVLVANQTRCIEAVVDPDGRWLANTPVITVAPVSPGDLWRVAAVIVGPLSTVIAHRVGAGSGMSSGAVRLTAKMIGNLPLPMTSDAAWDDAAALVEVTVRSPGDAMAVRDHLIQVGRLMLSAYGLGHRDDILEWWTERLPRVVDD